MAPHAPGMKDTRPLVVRWMTFALLASVLAFMAVGVVNTRTAKASGGACFVTTGVPVCTFSTHAASAEFTSVSSDGCASSDSFVEPLEALNSPGRATTSSVVILISQFNSCTGAQISADNIDPGTGMPDFAGTLEFGTRLDSASVIGSAPMFDAFGVNPPFTSTISLSWLGFGPATAFVNVVHFMSPGLIVNFHIRGVMRQATASGMLTDATNSNLASVPAENADLENDTGGTVGITRP